MEVIHTLLSYDLISATLRIMIPLLMAALGGVIVEKSGILSLALEGLMLGGAFSGFVGAFLSQSIAGAFLWVVGIGVLMGLLLAFFFVTLKADQVVVSLIFNIFILGVTGFYERIIFGIGHAIPKIPELTIVRIPLLSKIPVVGEIIFANQFVVFLALLLVPVLGFILNRTTVGLKIRFVGENPKAADTLGIKVYLTRYLSVIVGGILAAAGGSILTLGQTHIFTENIISGRGYMAMAMVIFGRWNPFGILIAAILFGFADALQLRIQGLSLPIPHEIPIMFPYIITILALLIFRGKYLVPASIGEAYIRE